MRTGAGRGVGVALVVLALAGAGCVSATHGAPRAREARRTADDGGMGGLPTPAGPTSAVAPPAPTGGVVPRDVDGYAYVVARSMVAVIRGGHAEFLNRIQTDVHRSSSCDARYEVAVFPRDVVRKEQPLARRAIRTERAREGVDGVGHARRRMLAGVDWPGVDHPFLVGVVVAIDCPDQP